MVDMNSPIKLVDYQLRSIALDISREDEYSEDSVLGVDFEFLQHDSDSTLFLIQLILTINEDAPANVEHLMHMRAEVEGYVQVPDGLNNECLRLHLVDGTALLYNTFRGTLTALLGQTAARDYILPAIDFRKIALQGAAR